MALEILMIFINVVTIGRNVEEWMLTDVNFTK
jgi:hypothetical protein